jgi:hypothetical protein
MTLKVRRLFDEIIAEIERRPDFQRRVQAALSGGETPPRHVKESSHHQATKGRRRNRRAPGPIDPFAVFAAGEAVLRRQLEQFSVDQLKDIVSEHAMDSSRLALKWKSADRLIDLISGSVKTRLEKGDAFRRDASQQNNPRGISQ